MDKFSKLDNPVWYSLNESHEMYGAGTNSTKFYDPKYCRFGGCINECSDEFVLEYAKEVDNFFVIGEKPKLSSNFELINELVCCQMILHHQIKLEINEQIIELDPSKYDELFELVNLVQPGYFIKDTARLGSYYGIFKDNQLVSVVGERMNTSDFTEVRAVVTRPGYTGRGYAKQLITHCVEKIFNENKTPFLHVLKTNYGVIKLYETLGFEHRRAISFWHLKLCGIE
jgi:ribosomal protein S18 acetylase RimI-like enzyme